MVLLILFVMVFFCDWYFSLSCRLKLLWRLKLFGSCKFHYQLLHFKYVFNFFPNIYIFLSCMLFSGFLYLFIWFLYVVLHMIHAMFWCLHLHWCITRAFFLSTCQKNTKNNTFMNSSLLPKYKGKNIWCLTSRFLYPISTNPTPTSLQSHTLTQQNKTTN
jgi:hypothetical protein